MAKKQAVAGSVHVEARPEPEVGVNEVHLVGRLSGPPETRSLPSGDELVQLRVVVRRRPDPGRGAAAAGSRSTVDTIDVTCWTGAMRRTALRLGDGDMVEVEGSLRRRFYRVGASVQSRYDVVASTVRRTPRAPRALTRMSSG